MSPVLISIFSSLFRILPYLYLSAVITWVAACVLGAFSRGIWVDQKRFKMLSVFYSLSKTGCFILAACWVRMIMVFIMLARFKVLETSDYGLFIIPGIISIIRPRRPAGILWAFLTVVLQLLGLIGSNIICGYITEYGGGLFFAAIYLFLAILLALFSVFVFFIDLGNVSESRRADVIKAAENIKNADDQ